MNWIRVSESLPKDGTRVFVKFEDGDISVGFIDFDYGGKFFPVGVESTYDGAGEVVFYEKIVAWAEIPKEMLQKL